MGASTTQLNFGTFMPENTTYTPPAVQPLTPVDDHNTDHPCECEARAAAMYKRAVLIQLLTIIFYAVLILLCLKMIFR